MCAATLFSVAQALRGRAGCLLQVEEPPGSFSPQFCEIVIEGLRLLIQEEED